jgi:hypothetical protein
MFFMYLCDAGGAIREGDPLQMVGPYLQRCTFATPCATSLGACYVFSASTVDFAVHPIQLAYVHLIPLEG